jgi:hypothetical protein
MSKRPSSLRRLLVGAKTAGFLTLHEIDDGGYRGSVLITDFKGIPIEFRCTQPLTPDAVQRSLYGEALLAYIGVEICGKPLLHAVKTKPNLLFVDKPFLLKLEEHAPCPTFLVQERAEDATEATPVHFDAAYHVEVLKARPDDLQPVELVTKGEVKPKTRALMEQLSAEVNIVEAFGRMKNAVGSLNQIASRAPAAEQ